MQLQARDKRALIGGAVVVTALLAFLMWPRGTGDGDVQLVPAEERGAPPPTTTNPAPLPPAAAPAPAPPVAAQPATPGQPAAAPGSVPEGLKLTGITATGAIFAYADGSQRLVYRGREIAPGLTLQALRVREVILSANGANLRLGFSGPAIPMQPTATPAPSAPAPAPPAAQPTPPPDRSLFR